MVASINSDAIGIDYRIDLQKLATSIREAKGLLNSFNASITAGAKKVGEIKAGIAPSSIKTISNAASELRSLGVTSKMTAKDIKALNLTAIDMQRVFEATKMRSTDLKKAMSGSGIATRAASTEYKQLTARLPDLEHEANKATRSMGDARRAMERWGSGFKYMMLSQAAWIASGAVLFGTITAIGSAIKDFVDFHQDLRDAAAIVQATTSGYKKMGDAAVKAFLNSTMSLKDTTNALKVLGQTGMDAADSAIALETVYKITTATGGDMATVVKFLTTAINVWGLEAADAAKVGNVLGAALNYSKLEVEDLGTTFNYVASMAKSVGLSITDLASIMAVMSNAGIKASTIGTGLRGVFSKLLAVTPKFEKQLVAVGLTMEDVSLITNDFFTVLNNLEKAGFDIENIFKGMTRREAAALNVMLEQGTEKFKLMAMALKDTAAVEVMFTRSMEGMKNQMILTGHAIKQYMIDRLKFLTPVITETAKYIRELFTALGDLNKVIFATMAAWSAYRIILMAVVALNFKATVATQGLAAATTALAGAAGILNKAWTFMKGHPLITTIAVLALAYAGLKRIMDATTVSTEEQMNKSNRRIDDLRKLQVLMLDSNRTEEEKLAILNDYSKDYPKLLELMGKHKIKIEDVIGATKELIKTEKAYQASITAGTLVEAQRDLARVKTLKRNLEGAWGETPIPGGTTYIEKDVVGIAKYNDEIRDLENNIDILMRKLKILKSPKIEKPTPKEKTFVWTSENQKDLDALKMRLMTEAKKIRQELINELAKFDMTEDLTQEQWEALKPEQANARIYILREYYKKRNELQAKAEKDKEKLNEKAIRAAEKELDLLVKIVAAEYKADMAAGKRGDKADADDLKKAEKFIKEKESLEKDFLAFQEDINRELIGHEEDGYDKKVKLWQLGVDKRKKILDRILKVNEDYYAALEIANKKSLKVTYNKEEAEAAIAAIKKLRVELELLAEKEKPKVDIIIRKDFAKGMEDGFDEARKTLADEHQQWKDLTENTAMHMSDTMSDVFFDGMTRKLKTAGDYWKAFSLAVQREIANIASKWLISGILGGDKKSGKVSWLSTLYSMASLAIGGKGAGAGEGEGMDYMTHKGGLIKRMHSGGQNLKDNETRRILKHGEYVIKDSSVRSIGPGTLDFMNRTGRVPGGNVVKNYNSFTIIAMDSESMDQAIRRGGAKAVADISLNNFAREQERRSPATRRF